MLLLASSQPRSRLRTAVLEIKPCLSEGYAGVVRRCFAEIQNSKIHNNIIMIVYLKTKPILKLSQIILKPSKATYLKTE